MSDMATDGVNVSLSLVAATGLTTVVLASALAYVLLQTRRKKQQDEADDDEPTIVEVDQEQYPGGQLTVYFATQTGTSESFAGELEREGPEHGFLVHVVDLEDIQVEELVEEVRRDADSGVARAIFLTATYGEGDAPDNAQIFVENLREQAATEILFEEKKNSDSEEPQATLLALEYCVFGLGNREYDHFNAMGKFFDHALERVGATRILPVGLGNDDDDLEGDFETWRENMWSAMTKRYIGDTSVLKNKAKKAASTWTLPDCPYQVEFVTKNGAPRRDFALEEVHSSSRHYFTSYDCPVVLVKELRSAEDSESTVHVEIDISKADGLDYMTADNLGVLPMNDDTVVTTVADRLGYDLNAVFSVKAAPSHEWHGAPFPMPVSVRECLTRYCDLTTAPRRSDLKLLASYAKDPVDKTALLRMSSKEGRSEYREKILDGYIGMVDLLKLCPSVEIPLEHFLSICPRLQTRFFTISSSSSVHPDTIHLTVAITQAERKDGSWFRGVCSNYLRRSGSTQVRVFNRPSTFRLPKDSSTPIIMIGPGTGVAPMRALLQERAYKKNELKQPVGPNILYFGCRKRSGDYLYQEELLKFKETNVLTKLYEAFSREQTEKVYVQHLIVQNAEETWRLLDADSAYVYVCGGVKMGHDVSTALKEIISSQGKLSTDDAKDYLAKLADEGRFVQELWG